MTTTCVFCDIIAKRTEGHIVFEDDRCIAILDIFPANPGHTLVMPKKHFSLLGEVPIEELTHAIQVVQRIGPAVQHAINAQGYNVLANNGSAAGQLVPHVHFHLVPRTMNDGMKFEWPRNDASEGELVDSLVRIRKQLARN